MAQVTSKEGTGSQGQSDTSKQIQAGSRQNSQHCPKADVQKLQNHVTKQYK